MIVFPETVPSSLGKPQKPAATLGAAVSDYLLGAIVDGSLAPGSPLTETELVTRLEISSTPIRDALNRLQQFGLVQIFSNRAKYVSPLEPDVARDVLRVRSILLDHTCHIIDGALDRDILRRIAFQLDRMSSSARTNENLGIISAGFRIERLLVEASGNAEILRILDSREHYLARQIMLGNPGWTADEPARWRQIVEALETDDYTLFQTRHSRRMADMLRCIEAEGSLRRI